MKKVDQGFSQLTYRHVTGIRKTLRRHTRNLQQSLEFNSVVSGWLESSHPVHPAHSPFHGNPPQIRVSGTEVEGEVLLSGIEVLAWRRELALDSVRLSEASRKDPAWENVFSRSRMCSWWTRAVQEVMPQQCGEALIRGQGHLSRRVVTEYE